MTELLKIEENILAKQTAQEIIEAVAEGNANALDVKRKINAIKTFADMVDKGTRPYQITEAEKYSAKSFEFEGTKFQIASKSTYSYENCNDPEMNKLLEEMKILKEKIKLRESFLKGIGLNGQTIFDEETGEVIQLYPPAVSSSEYLKIMSK